MSLFFHILLSLCILCRAACAGHIPAAHGRRYANSSYAKETTSRHSTTARLGDFIAAGLGGAGESSSTLSISPTITSQSFTRPLRDTATSARSLATGLSVSGNSIVKVGDNATILVPNPSSNQCWTQWDNYWSLNDAMTTLKSTFTSTVDGFSAVQWSIPVYTSTKIFTETLTEGIGNFASTTLTTTVTSGQVVSETRSFITLSNEYEETYTVAGSTSITTPPCQLPSYVSQCQIKWETWVVESGGLAYHTPHCTQASITGDLCSTARSSWLAAQGNQEISGKIGMQVTYPTRNGTTVWSEGRNYWPTSSLIAPGCSVGCQSCRVSGSQVQLLYWPPATTASGYGNGSLFAATTLKATGPVTAITHGTTLTSPTVYVSFDQLHASNSCGVIGSTLRNIIVAITDSATLSSLYGWGHYFGSMQTASFNFTDLYHTSVPDEIYNSQPRCASSADALRYSCLPLGTAAPPTCTESFSCTRTLPYEPVLSIPVEVRKLQPEWAECLGGLIGVYDPPTALHPVSVADAVSTPNVGDTSTVTTTSVGSVPTALPASPSPMASVVAPLTQTVGVVATQATVASSSIQGDPVFSPSAGESQSQSFHDAATIPTTTNALDVLTAALSQLSEGTSQQSSSIEIPNVANTLSAGGAAVTISGQTISVGSSAVIIDGTTAVFSQAAPAPASSPVAVVTLGTTTVTVQQGVPVVVGSSTLSTGAAATIGSQTVSLASSGVIVDGSSVAFSQAAPNSINDPAAVVTLGSSTITAQQGQPIILGGSALSLGSDPVAVGTQTISVDASGVVVDGSSIGCTQAFSFEPETTTAMPVAVVTLGTEAVTFVQSQPVVLDGTVLSAGDDPATVNGQTISLAPSAVIIDGHSAAFTQLPSSSSDVPVVIFTVGSQIVTAHQGQPLTLSQADTPSPNTALIPIAVSAVTSGPAVTLTGGDHATNIAVQVGSDIVVLNPTTTAVLGSGQNVVVGSETLSYGSGGLVAGTSTLTSLLSVAAPQIAAWTATNGHEYTVVEQGNGVMIAGPSITITLADGRATMIAGDAISALSDGNGLLVNGTPTSLPDATSSMTESRTTSSVSLPAITRLGGPSSTSTTASIGSSGPTATTSTSDGARFEMLWTMWLAVLYMSWEILR